MQASESFEVHLPPDLMASVTGAVKAGEYPSNNDVVLAALFQWKVSHDQPLQNLIELRALCEAGEASGIAPEKSIDDIIAQARRKFGYPAT